LSVVVGLVLGAGLAVEPSEDGSDAAVDEQAARETSTRRERYLRIARHCYTYPGRRNHPTPAGGMPQWVNRPDDAAAIGVRRLPSTV
jgi:hypothetical protein